MNDLIKIQQQNIGGQTIETVNARELHAFLGVQTRYNDWIKNRIEQYGFCEGIDFLTLTENLVSGGFQKTHYITVDMAKELAMVERNEKGRQARQYFIECERRLKQQTTPVMLSPIESDLKAIGIVADILRASESSKLGMLRTYCEQNAPRILPVLPAYAIDAQIISGVESSASSEPTAPITKIVAGITSAAKANKALHAAGLLEQRFRETSTGGQKAFWSVTEKGAAYGKNVTHPNRPLETQPHWYLSKKVEIGQIASEYLVS